jgi:hypothetical protein
VLSVLIATNTGHMEPWRITTLSFFTAEYVSLDALYLGKTWTWRDPRSKKEDCKEYGVLVESSRRTSSANNQHVFIVFSAGTQIFSAVVWILAIVSLTLYLFDQINYTVSLCVSNTAKSHI